MRLRLFWLETQALGVLCALAQRGVLEHAFCTETRPYNQGVAALVAAMHDTNRDERASLAYRQLLISLS